MRHGEASALEPFVIDDEPASAEKQDLYAISAAPEEDEERAAVRIGAPERADERDEAIMAATEIHRLRREHDLNARTKAQHPRAEADTIAARCSAVTAPRNVIRAGPTSTNTSRPCSGPAGAARAGVRTTTGSSRGFLPFLSRDFLRSCERHQSKVRVRTPCCRAIASASPPSASSSTRFAHHSAGCLPIRALQHGGRARARRPSPYGYVSAFILVRKDQKVVRIDDQQLAVITWQPAERAGEAEGVIRAHLAARVAQGFPKLVA